jgi:hypothetical protein
VAGDGLTSADLARFQSGISYKPGYRFRFDPDRVTSGVYVTVDAAVEDAYHPGRRVRLAFREWCPAVALRDEETLLLWLRGFRHRFEKHESDEWFTYQGERVFDPHERGRR